MFTYRLNALVTVALVGCMLMFQLSRAQSDLYEVEPKRQAQRKYCGKQLANALQLVCHGLYNSMLKKSTGQGMEMDDYQVYDDTNPFRTRPSAHTMLGKLFGTGRFRRESRGVFDECCLKPCTYSELNSYCARSNE